MILEVNELEKSFGKNKVLNGVNLSIEEPRLICLIAPNGSGKTTLMNIIANLDFADTGEVTIFDFPNHHADIFENLTYLQDNKVLYEELTGWDHLNLVGELNQKTTTDIISLTDQLKMTHYLTKTVKNYSLGMKQHLLWALALLPNAELLLMDEPFNGLDPASVVRTRHLVQKMYHQGKSFIISTHVLTEVEKLTEDIYFLCEGQLVHQQELNHDSEVLYSLVVNDVNLLSDLLGERGIANTIVTNHKIQFATTKEMFLKLKDEVNTSAIEIYDIDFESKKLEHLYLELFGDDEDDD